MPSTGVPCYGLNHMCHELSKLHEGEDHTREEEDIEFGPCLCLVVYSVTILIYLLIACVSLCLQFSKRSPNTPYTIRNHVKNKVFSGMVPLIDLDCDRAHEILALMLDPRYSRDQTLQSVHGDQATANALWKHYYHTVEALIPSAVTLASNRLSQRIRTADDDDNAGAKTAETGFCDSDCA